MRIAIIDLGTNSVRFDVHQLGPGNRVRTLHREKLMVRLGQGVFTAGKLDPEAIRRTLEAFTSFKRTAQDLHANRTVAFGTSALREASDGDRLLTAIRRKTGIDISVISGTEEARLIAVGVLAHETLPSKGRFGLIDIGGGSTEITLCQGRQVEVGDSFPLGTARLQQVFLKSSPPAKSTKRGELSAVDQLRRYIKSILLPKMIGEEWPRSDRLYGSSGTIKALAKLARKHVGGGKTIDRGDLRKLVKTMSTMTTTQLLGMAGMESKRVDMILAGAVLLEECMDSVKASKIHVTEYSLRDGILEEQVQSFLKQKGPQIAIRLPVFYEKALKLGVTKAHIDSVVELSSELFDRLKPLHKLPVAWKAYLTAAAVLHDVGESISPSRHETHSYYIVKNADFPSMEPWEVEFIAQLCLHHRGGNKFGQKDLPIEPKTRRQAFLKLLALLRVADALDRGHKGMVKIKAIKLLRGDVKLTLEPGGPGAKGSIDLELLRIEQKKELFENVFGRELVVEKSSG